MNDSVLTVAKVLLLGLMYLFFARVLWAVWSEVRTPIAPRGVVSPRGTQAGGPRRTGTRRGKGATVLVVIEPRTAGGGRHVLSSVLTIGRDPGCDIAMPDDTFMSGLHARVETRPGGAAIVDVNSTNGVRVNGRRISTERSLHDGDRIQVGNTVLEVRA